MKNAMKILIGSMVLVSALSACGKKSKSTASTGGAAAVGYGGCPLNAQGFCASAAAGGSVLRNTWESDEFIMVTNPGKFSEFAGKNGLCSGFSCANMSQFVYLKVQTVRRSLPNYVNFTIAPAFNMGGIRRRALETRGEGFMNGAGNGFNVLFNRYNNNGMGFGTGFGMGIPMGVPVAAQAPTQSTLQIVVNYVDATMTVVEAVVIFEGTPIAQGRLFAREPIANRVAYTSGNGQQAPEVIPYRSSSK